MHKMSTTTTTTTDKPNEWDHPPSEFDFRSDTTTSPTRSMLDSLAHASLGDDVFGESTTTTALESRLANLFHKPASIFVLSGTMANQLSLRAHLLQPPHSVLCDARSHVQLYEAGGLASLSQAVTIPVVPTNGLYLTLRDVVRNAITSTDVHQAPTRAISLENTLGGVVMPLATVREISRFAHAHGIKVHLDGARLWNACAGVPELREYAGEVDSVAVCFSKSLGAPVGSAVVGGEGFVERVRHLRKAVGGGVRQAGVVTAMAEVALDEVYLKGRLRVGDELAERLARRWVGLGGVLELPRETNMVWLDLGGRGVTEEEWERVAGKWGVKVLGGRIVCHYQNSVEAVERVERAMEEVCGMADERRVNGVEGVVGSEGTCD